MNAADATAFQALLDFLQAIGVGFGDVVILIVLFGAGWLISKGKIKIGNGNGYAKEETFNTAVGEINGRLDRHFKVVEGLREDVTDLTAKVAKLDGQVEQFRNK